MMKLKVLDQLNDKRRISSIDVYRSLAIIVVVIFHFNQKATHQIGIFREFYLGVDMFLVISGLLVGGLLKKQYDNGTPINFLKFVLQRGFKIWPSYYSFLLLGSLVAYLFYHITYPSQIIPLSDLKRYVFFYLNYTGAPYHWSFDHLWSLCVEEHFYILLPIMYIVIQRAIPKVYQNRALFIAVALTILAGIVFKFISYYFTRGQDTYAGTHNRLDALAWGVMLNLLIGEYGDTLKASRYTILFFWAGVLLFACVIYLDLYIGGVFIDILTLYSFTSFCFFLMLLGTYYVDLSSWKPLRFVAYYSYNWYLWHPVFAIYISAHIQSYWIGMIVFAFLSFTVAMIATILIEEPFLERRKFFLDKIFKKGVVPFS